MQAVILAGGKGERLMPLTADIPKPMVLINGKPYLQYQIELLEKQGIKDIVILVGYLKEKIMDYFGDGRKFGVSISYSIENDPLGTGGAIKKAEKLLNEVFFIIYGDSFLPIDLNEVWSVFELAGKDALCVVYDNKEDTYVTNNISLDEDNNVVIYDKKKLKKLDFVEAGILILKKDVLRLINPANKVSLEEEIFPMMIKDKRLSAFITDQQFYDIGTKERLDRIKEFFKKY